MATPTYTAKVLKLTPTHVELELKASLDEIVYAWPSLALRALADAPGSPLSPGELLTRSAVEEKAAAWIVQVEVLATRKGLAQYRIEARRPELLKHLKKGLSWPTSRLHCDDHRYGEVALADKVVAAVVELGGGLPCGVVELIAITKKGPGATKAWLNHLGVRGVDARADRILSWSPDRFCVWSDTGALLHEQQAPVSAGCLTDSGVAIGSSQGIDIDGAHIDVGPVTALAWSSGKLWAVTAAGELLTLAGSDVIERRAVVPGTKVAVHGEQAVVLGDDGCARWYDAGRPVDEVYDSCYEGRSVGHVAPVPDGFLVAGYRDIFMVRTDGELRVLEPGLDAGMVSAAGDYLLGVTYGDRGRARLFRADGEMIGELVVPKSHLSRAQLTTKAPPVRLTQNGEWVLCAEASSEEGGVLLVSTQGLGQVRFPNPDQRYGFLNDVEQVGPESFLVGYGGYDALLWTLDGAPPRDLGRRVDRIWHGNGRTLVSKDRVVTALDTSLQPCGDFTVDIPYGLHWLEVSGDGRYVVLGAQPRAWVRDLESGDQWEVEQQEGVDAPSFGGHPHYFMTLCMRDKKIMRVWDARSRKVVLELPDISFCHGIRWTGPETFLAAETNRFRHFNLEGECLMTLELVTKALKNGPIRSVGFDEKGRLLAHAGHQLYAWSKPGERRVFGGYRPPTVFSYTPGWCITFGQWPALPMRIP